MKLQDLDNLKIQDKAARVLRTRLGESVSFKNLSVDESQAMLNRVRGLIEEHRSTPEFHRSENNPAYLKLLMMEQGLAAQVTEQQKDMVLMPVSTKDPKVQQTLKKATSGQILNPDEQKLVTAMATQQKKESVKPKRMVKESEIQQAQVVLAAQDMIDRIQGMLEDISEMQFKDLPALTDSIKNDMGTDQAAQFQSAASAALTQLLAAMQQGKTAMEGAQGALTGQAPVVPGTDDAGLAAPVGDESDADLGADADEELGAAEMPPREEEDDEEEITASLGRERR